jgi:hypothetical protein
MAELAAKEVAGDVVAIYLGDSGQARNTAKAPANHVDAFPKKQHELRLAQSEHPAALVATTIVSPVGGRTEPVTAVLALANSRAVPCD